MAGLGRRRGRDLPCYATRAGSERAGVRRQESRRRATGRAREDGMGKRTCDDLREDGNAPKECEVYSLARDRDMTASACAKIADLPSPKCNLSLASHINLA